MLFLFFILHSGQQSISPLVVNTEMPSIRGRASLFVDTVRPLNDKSAYYLLLFDPHHQDKIIACAPLLRQRPKQATALFKGSSVQGKQTHTHKPFP